MSDPTTYLYAALEGRYRTQPQHGERGTRNGSAMPPARRDPATKPGDRLTESSGAPGTLRSPTWSRSMPSMLKA